MSETLTRPNSKFQSRLQIKEGNCPALKFLANDALRRQAKTFTVEAYCTLQIVNGERDTCDSWFHLL